MSLATSRSTASFPDCIRPGSIDAARPYFEYDVADCNIFVIQSAYFQYTS